MFERTVTKFGDKMMNLSELKAQSISSFLTSLTKMLVHSKSTSPVIACRILKELGDMKSNEPIDLIAQIATILGFKVIFFELPVSLLLDLF